MTVAGTIFLVMAAALVALWILDLIRRGRLYVGYGIVLLVLMATGTVAAGVPGIRQLLDRGLASLFPSEPVAVLCLASGLLLVIYLLHQLSVLSDRVAHLTQELAIRRRSGAPDDEERSLKS